MPVPVTLIPIMQREWTVVPDVTSRFLGDLRVCHQKSPQRRSEEGSRAAPVHRCGTRDTEISRRVHHRCSWVTAWAGWWGRVGSPSACRCQAVAHLAGLSVPRDISAARLVPRLSAPSHPAREPQAPSLSFRPFFKKISHSFCYLPWYSIGLAKKFVLAFPKRDLWPSQY